MTDGFSPFAIAALLANALALPFAWASPEARAALTATLIFIVLGSLGSLWNLLGSDTLRLLQLAVWAPLGVYLLKRSLFGGPPFASLVGVWLRVAMILTLTTTAIDLRAVWLLLRTP